LKINEDFPSVIDELNNETSITDILAIREKSLKQNGGSLTVVRDNSDFREKMIIPYCFFGLFF